MDERNRVYYVDHNTRTTTWMRPDINFLNAQSTWQHSTRNRNQDQFNARSLFPQPQESSSQENDQLGPLPEGWEKRKDKTNRVNSIKNLPPR